MPLDPHLNGHIMTFLLNHLMWVTLLAIFLVLSVAVLIVWFLHRIFHDQPVITPVSVVVVNVILAALVGLLLNNLWGMKRDRDGRLWNLQQQHLGRLRVTLKAEADGLKAVATAFQQEGYITDVHGMVLEPQPILTRISPDVLSSDLENHYPDYVSAKRELARKVANHDKSFAQATTLAGLELNVQATSLFNADTVALTFVEQNLGKGTGLILQRSTKGFLLAYFGSSLSSSLPVDPRVISVSRRYDTFRPTDALVSRLKELRESSDGIEQSARQLSDEALLLAEQTRLPGKCAFVQMPGEP
jgi:hypothetical protein